MHEPPNIQRQPPFTHTHTHTINRFPNFNMHELQIHTFQAASPENLILRSGAARKYPSLHNEQAPYLLEGTRGDSF